MDEQLGCSPLLTIVLSVATDMAVRISFEFLLSILLDVDPGLELLIIWSFYI